MMEYREGFNRLNGLHKSHRQNQERYIILFKLCSDISQQQMGPQESLLLRIYNGAMLWMLHVHERVFEHLRYKSGVEGSDSAICDMINHAITTNGFSLDRQRTYLSLSLQFQLGRGVFVKASLEMGDALPVVDDADFRLVNQMFVFDLYDSMFMTQIQAKVPHRKESPPKAELPLHHDFNKATKPMTDIVRPNQKKRRGVGAKLS